MGPVDSEGRADSVLELDQIDVWLAGRQILDQVGFSIRAGQFTGLIGSNGAGKTTIFRVILGLQAPTSGRVLISGAPRNRRSGLIGYVPQRVVLDPDMPLRSRDLVALGLNGQRFGISLPSKRRNAQVEEALAAVDAESFADARVGTLSGGEQQRVLIAHAIVNRPKLLLLDEPLANLDIRSAQGVVGLLSRVAKENDIAVLISAHEMNALLPVMDRVIYVASGRVASGTTEEVVRQDVLSELYGHHVDVLHVHDRIIVLAAPEVGLEQRHSDLVVEPTHWPDESLRDSP